jgi:hypothetical protein
MNQNGLHLKLSSPRSSEIDEMKLAGFLVYQKSSGRDIKMPLKGVKNIE